jgi:hypothetical protein
MPVFLAIIAVVFITASVRGTHKQFWELLKGDFSGPGNFIYWGLSIWVIVAVGYVKALRPISDAFLTLVIVVLILANGQRGFFNKFMSIIGQTQYTGDNNEPLDLANSVKSLIGLPTFAKGAQSQGSKMLKDMGIPGFNWSE